MTTTGMTPQQRHWWKIALELKLRRCNGDAFQDFFSNVMTASHGDDFVRVRAFGKLGDKGCDGYLDLAEPMFLHVNDETGANVPGADEPEMTITIDGSTLFQGCWDSADTGEDWSGLAEAILARCAKKAPEVRRRLRERDLDRGLRP